MAGGVLMLALSVVAVIVAAALAAVALPGPAGQPRLTVAGVAQIPCQSRALPVPGRLNAQFEANSSILVGVAGTYLAPGRLIPPTAIQSACAAVAERASRDWLRSGLVPGVTAVQRSMAARALLDLRLAVQPDGAVLASWRPGWTYAWPRDSSLAAAALAQTGHPALAYQILLFLQRMQAKDGTWAARYWPDGSGPVRDGRADQLDADGWVPWAVWSWAQGQPFGPGSPARRDLTRLWPMVTRAADAAARSLTRDGLPEPAMDYWEDSVEVTLGTAAPLLAGLRAAAELAARAGGPAAAGEARRWAADASGLAAAITAAFGADGYQRTPQAGSGADAAITFLGPPFARPSAAVLRAAAAAQRVLAVANGGLQPGADWPGTPGVAWTPETAFFALFDAATGQHRQAATLLDWLAAHRTKLGSLPEKVNAAGQPACTAPLSLTDAVTLLAMVAQARHLPAVPVRR